MLWRSASQILSIAQNSSRAESGALPPSFTALAIWLMFRPIDANSPILRLSVRNSSFGKGVRFRRCERIRTET